MKLHFYLGAFFILGALACQPASTSNNLENTAIQTATNDSNALVFQNKTYTIPTLPNNCTYEFKSVFLEKGDMAIVNKINTSIADNEKQAITMNYGKDVFNIEGKSTQDLIEEEIKKWHQDLANNTESYTKKIQYKGHIEGPFVIIEKDFYSMLGVSVKDHKEKEYLVFDAKTGKQLIGANDFFTNPKAVQDIIEPLYVKEHGIIFDMIDAAPIFMLPEQILYKGNNVLFYYTSKELGYGAEPTTLLVDKSLLKDFLRYK